MKQKLLTLFTLLLCVCSGAWANQTNLITDVTLPDIPASTLDMGSQTTYTPDANGWIVFNPYSVTATWWAVTTKSAQTENYTKEDGDGFTAPFVTQTSDTQKINSSGNYAAAIRFTGATDVSFLVSPRSTKSFYVGLYSYNGETQTLIEEKSVSGNSIQEIHFGSLNESTNYIAYLYGKEKQNQTIIEIALKKTVDTTPAAVSITSPASDPELIEITQGQTTTLNITASGYPAPEYQWYRNTSKSTVGATELTGANSASYTTPNNLAVGTWYYYCVADNTSGDPATSPYFSVKVNALGADLTVHEPGIYEKSAGEGGYGQTLKEMEVDEVTRQYEIYAMGSANSANYWFAGTRTTKPSDANCLSTEGFTTSFAASNIAGSWMKGEVTGRGSSFNTATEEFPAQASSCYTVKINTSDKSVMIKVSGYDQIGILGKDNNATASQGKHFVVKINGEEQDMTLSTSYTVRRFSLNPDIESVIEITGSTTSADNHLVGFSLRLPIDTATPTISTEQDEEDATIGTPLNLTVTANHYTGLQWYKAEESNLSDAAAIEGATSATYAYTAVKADALKTYYFYCVATNDNATGEDEAQSSTITVTVGDYERSTECKALQVVYSNGFDAFITHPAAATYYVAEDEEVIAGTKNVGDIKTTATNGRVVAYYVAGSSIPTISSTTLSDDATYDVEGTTLTVTAEDGTTTGVYDISLTSVEPYTGGNVTFDGKETWVKAPYGFDNEKGYKYQRLKRDNESTDPWDRLTPGNTRIYMFLGANTSVTIKTTNSNGNVDVKVNTVTVKNNQAWGDGKAIEVTNDLNAPYLLGIYSHQTSGDNYVSSIEITKPTTVNGTISKAGWSTFSSNYALDLSTISGGTAYVATESGENVTMTKTTAKVAAGTGLMIMGNEDETFTIDVTSEDTEDVDNLLVGLPNGGTVAAGKNNYVFAWTTGDVKTAGFWYVDDAEPVLGAGKAYLHTTGGGAAKLNIIIADNETDGINAVVNEQAREGVYDLQGRKVTNPTKGLYIVNGKKVVIK